MTEPVVVAPTPTPVKDPELVFVAPAPAPSTIEYETFLEKAKRKFSKEPLIPFGAMATTLCLIYGLNAFQKGDKALSQKMMRFRVLAQGFTVLAMCAGAYIGFKPHNRPPNMEIKMERLENGKTE